MKRHYNLIKSFLNPNQVSYLILYVTNRCNFRCSFCFYHSEINKGHKPDELTLDEIYRISIKLGPIIQLSLTGGEPFLRRDLSEITNIFIRNNFVKYLTVPTNASLTEKIEEYLENVLPEFPSTFFRIPFSIDGIGEQHDKIRSSPGAYDKVMKTYSKILPLKEKYHNLILDANSVYASSNEDTILKTLEILSEDFNFDNLSVTYTRGNIKNPSLKKVSAKKYIELNDYLQQLKRTKEKRFLYPFWRAVRDISREHLIDSVFHDKFVSPCVAGRKFYVISETGEVNPCEILKKSMGNVRDFNYDIKKLLRQENNKKLIKWIVDSKCQCSFECALSANVLWGKASYLKLLKAAIKNIGTS